MKNNVLKWVGGVLLFLNVVFIVFMLLVLRGFYGGDLSNIMLFSLIVSIFIFFLPGIFYLREGKKIGSTNRLVFWSVILLSIAIFSFFFSLFLPFFFNGIFTFLFFFWWISPLAYLASVVLLLINFFRK